MNMHSQALSNVQPESGHLEALTDALQTERRLLDELGKVLVRQRESIGKDDLEAIDESVYSAQRVLRTLQEARRRRRSLLELIGVDRELPLRELEDELGAAVSDVLAVARDELLSSAEVLSRELNNNRQVIDGALSVGEQLLRVFTGNTDPPPLYQPGAEADKNGGAAGALLNTRV